MSAKIIVDTENKLFLLSQKDFDELMNNPAGDIGKQIKGLLALGCYDGYVPGVSTKSAVKKENFNEDGVRVWLENNNPEWLAKWEASKKVKTPGNHDFSFMVRKNYFLFENPEARAYCGMKPDEERKTSYALTDSAAQLKKAVEKLLAKK